MNRTDVTPRADWQQKCEQLGFTWHSVGGRYWDESVAYVFTPSEVALLEKSTNDLMKMCFSAVDYVIEHKRYTDLRIPFAFVEKVKQTWQQDAPTLYGRFDLAYDGQHPPKLLEFNADTPTSLFEASVVQWTWLQECHRELDQFNGIHEALLDQLRYFKRERGVSPLYFGCAKDSSEDAGTVKYLVDLALQAGIDARFIYMDEIGWDQEWHQFLDGQDQTILHLFKLYPWEWLVQEEFGPHLLSPKAPLLIEPAWKMVLSNKGILAILWEMFPDHPNLLPAFFAPSPALGSSGFVQKPLLSREGGNITLHQGGEITEQNDGPYGQEGYVYQQYMELPNMAPPGSVPRYPVVGSWIVGEDSVGIGVRESETRITTDGSQFIPHFIR